IWKCQVFKHEVEKFFLGNIKREIIHAFAGIARAFTASASRPTFWPLNLVSCDEITIAWQNANLFSSLAMMKDGFANVLRWNADFFPAMYVGDGALVDSFRNRFFDVLPVALQKPLPIYS